jgi:hypothetical protein
MKPEAIRHLRRRKFPLITRWKLLLGRHWRNGHEPSRRMPPALIFHSFDEIVGSLKSSKPEGPKFGLRPLMTQFSPHPPFDGTVEVFLTGKETLVPYLIDEAFGSEDATERADLQEALYTAFNRLARRELLALESPSAAARRGWRFAEAAP